MATSSRKTALTALSEVTENEGYSNIVIDKAIRAAELSPRDAALTSTIFYGVLEKRLTLDFYIRKFLAKPKQKLDGTVLNILRIAVYQMMYLDRVPDSAAVNEAVLCAAEYRRGQYKNFVNGVLRSFARGWHEVIIPEDDLSVRYNIPQPIIESFKKDYGETVCIDLLKAMSERAETYIRINPLKTTADDLIQSLPENTAEKAVLQNALCVHGTGDVTGLPGFAEGKFHVQDLSSQLLCAFVSPQPGERLADVCAAPGGKSFAAAIAMENRGSITSCDLHAHKIALIAAGAERLGISIIEAKAQDAAAFCPEWEQAFDAVIADVPCSGLGVIRKKPDIRYKSPKELAQLPLIQRAILENAASYVRPGGTLVYSTCTVLPEENEDVTGDFLDQHPEFEPVRTVFPLPVGPCPGQVTLWPQRHGTDGFYICRMRRKD